MSSLIIKLRYIVYIKKKAILILGIGEGNNLSLSVYEKLVIRDES